MLILDNEQVRSVVLANGKILEAFPHFYPLRQQVMGAAGCASCQKNAAQETAMQALAKTRQIIGTMPAADKQRLKELLGGGPIRVYWTGGYGANEKRERADF